MTEFTQLQRSARERATARGHTLTTFTTVCRENALMGVFGRVALADCTVCGAWVRVDLRHDSAHSTGRALEVKCFRGGCKND